MCLSTIKVKSKSPYGIRRIQVPCGHCAECRQAHQNQWTTRLKAEIEEYHVRKNYNVGFITLTYQEACLPTIPKAFFKPGEYERIPCFSYNDIKKFVDTIRNYFFRKRRWRDAFRFFITSEYGEDYHRPHYHGILLFTNRISHEEMYKIVEDSWCGSSQIIPQPRRKALRRKPLGIVAPFDSFVPRDPQACGKYVAKYVCKDLAFQSEVSGKFDHLSRVMRNHLRHFEPFHKQSMGFGYCLIRGKSDEELLELYENGVQFTGHPAMVELPVYLKNKILFNNYVCYNLKAHKFETRKVYTKLLMENRDRIAHMKCRQAYQMFRMYDSKEYWQKKQAPLLYDDVHEALSLVDPEELAWFYTLYHGIPATRCPVMDSPGDVLVTRYDPIADCTELPRVDYWWHRRLELIIDFVMSCVGHAKPDYERSDEDVLLAKIRALFNQ